MNKNFVAPVIDALSHSYDYNHKNDKMSYSNYIDCIQRDLENLLNNKMVMTFRRFHGGIFRYGISSFTEFFSESEDFIEKISVSIIETIKMFEPRLNNIRVNFSKKDEYHNMKIRLNIEADIVFYSGDQKIMFESIYDCDKKFISIGGDFYGD